jgi:hypothetical protein
VIRTILTALAVRGETPEAATSFADRIKLAQNLAHE